jgi:hypothetical protein
MIIIIFSRGELKSATLFISKQDLLDILKIALNLSNKLQTI